MATYGINFPFADSPKGDYLKMTTTPEEEIKTDLIHLLLTRKGSRYFLPDFGTRLYEYIFEPNDTFTFNLLETEIRDAISKFIPNLDINSITIDSAENLDLETSVSEDEDERLFRVSSEKTKEYTARVKIDYTVNNGTFSSSGFIILNI